MYIFRKCVHFDVVLEHVPPGTGPPPTHTQATIPRCRNILDSGRGLYYSTQPDEVEPIRAVLSAEGLFLGTLVDTQDETDELLEKATHWSAREDQFGWP